MKTIKKEDSSIVFQGDILIERAKALPKGAVEQKVNIVAHSETGHHHVAERAKVFTVPNGEELFMRALGKSVDIVHKRNYDTHEPIRFETKPGEIFRVRRQREYTPEGWRRVED